MFKGLIVIILMVLVGHSPIEAAEASTQKIRTYFNNNHNKSYVDPYRNLEKRGENLEQVLVDAIEKAQSSVLLAVQELRLPAVASALIKKHQAGIPVKVILENQYNKDIRALGQSTFSGDGGSDEEDHDSSKYFDLFAFVDTDFDGEISYDEMKKRDAVFMLADAGITIKDDTFDLSHGSGLMHHKFLVIDNETVVVSSANFTLSGVHGDFLNDASIGNANGMIVIDSPEAAEVFAEEFYIMWGGDKQKLGSRFGVRKPYRPPRNIQVGDSTVTIQFSPTSKIQHWPTTVNGLIGKTLEQAKHSIDMALFVYSDQEISEVLRKQVLKKPELHLQVLVEPKFAYRSYSELLDMWGLKMLDEHCKYEVGNHPWRRTRRAQGGVPLLNRGDVLHHKFAIVDNRTVIFGSQNWSDAANFINDEYVVIVKDEEVAKDFKIEFDRLYQSSRLGPSKNLIKKIKAKEDTCLNQ